MKILFLVLYPEQAPSPRYRVFQMIPWLRAQGVECEVKSLVSSEQYKVIRAQGRVASKAALMAVGWAKRLRHVINSGHYSAIYLLKNAFPLGYPFFESLLAAKRSPLIVDYDDAIYLRPPSEKKSIRNWFRPTRHFNLVLKKAEAVFVPNQFLAEHSLKYNRCVHVVPEAEDTERLIPKRSQSINSTARIGWVGSPSTVRYLDVVEPALRELNQIRDDVLVTTVGGTWNRPGIRSESIPWSLEDELKNFHRLDIGLMPLEDTDWCRAKSGCKLRQYMATGVPSVSSAVGYNKELVQDGVTGFLVENTPDCWLKALRRLLDDAELRHSISKAARKSCVNRFAIDRVGPVLLQSLEQVVAGATTKTRPTT